MQLHAKNWYWIELTVKLGNGGECGVVWISQRRIPITSRYIFITFKWQASVSFFAWRFISCLFSRAIDRLFVLQSSWLNVHFVRHQTNLAVRFVASILVCFFHAVFCCCFFWLSRLKIVWFHFLRTIDLSSFRRKQTWQKKKANKTTKKQMQKQDGYHIALEQQPHRSNTSADVCAEKDWIVLWIDRK